MMTRPKPGESAKVLRPSHLRREVKTALELAIAALAPVQIVDSLATAAGLLEALGEFPPDAPPVLAHVPRTLELSTKSLEGWTKWEATQGRKA
jgi:hypothetical protein